MKKNIYKNKSKGKVDGICYGLGRSFDINPNIIRIFFVLSSFIMLIGVILYGYFSFILIDENQNDNTKFNVFQKLRTNIWVIFAPIILIALFATVLLISGDFSKYDISGEYSTHVYGEKMGSFSINKDGTFSFNSKMFGGINRNGKWEKIGEDTILLHYSDGATKTIFINRDHSSFKIGSTTYYK